MAYNDDDEDDSRGSQRRSNQANDSSGSAVKIFLIIFGSLGGLLVLSCCGAGAWLYFKVQEVAKQVAMTNPADIQKLTAEMTDITIPPEFQPQSGNSLFGMKAVQYQWCPAGNCPQSFDGMGTLRLTSLNVADATGTMRNINAQAEAQFTDKALQKEWKDFTKTEHEFDIHGRKCKFHIIQGEHTPLYDINDDLEDMEDLAMPDEEPDADTPATTAEPGTVPTPAAETAAPEATPVGPGVKKVRIHGLFPGKEAECTLEIQLTPEDYDEAKILEMLRSIR